MDSVQSVLQEILTWELAPCQELSVSRVSKSGKATKEIMLYGPTQVGKTTLLMNMMGVLPQKQDALRKILRGGASTGNSATSTAVIYSKWDNSLFGLSTRSIDEDPPEPEPLTENEFSEKIVELNRKNRSAISSASHDYKGVFHYFIPANYFADAEEDNDVEFIDLPGFGEKNEIMRQQADMLISQYASRVDGAIIVAKANNLLKIKKEYNSFISKFNPQRLIFVITYAVKECIEVKRLVEGRYPTTLDEEKALLYEFAQTYHTLIDLDNPDMDGIGVVPVELDSYLKEFYPQLCNVFRHSRPLLRECIKQIPSKNTFSAYEEMIALEIKNRNEQNDKLRGKISKKIQELNEAEKKITNLNEKQQRLSERFQELSADIDEKSDVAKKVLDAIDQSKTIDLISGYYVKNSLMDMLLMNSNEKSHYLISIMIKHLEQWIPEEGTRDYHELRQHLIAEGSKKICEIDVQDLLIKRDGVLFRKFGRESQDYVDRIMAQTAGNIRSKMRSDIRDWEKNQVQEPTDEREKVLNKQAMLMLVLREERLKIDDLEASIADLERLCRENQAQVQLLDSRKTNVRAVFIKHFFLKKKELEQRIAKEKSPEMKVALLLVLSTIYTNMRKHIEEEEMRR